MNLGIVVRTTGEPTSQRLIEQLKTQFGSNVPLKVVSADSFGEVLALSYQAAIAMDKAWNLIIDGDLLLSWHFKKIIDKACAILPNEAFGYSLQVFDRFYDRPKFRGIHIYRSKYLPTAYQYIDISINKLRPEAAVKKQMLSKGIVWHSYYPVVGLHDFFQHPEEIFSKMAIRAHRSNDDISYLKQKFEYYSRTGEKDFRYALAGLEYGLSLPKEEIKNERNVYLDVFYHQFPEIKNKIISIPNDFAINAIFIQKLFRHSPRYFIKNLFRMSNA